MDRGQAQFVFFFYFRIVCFFIVHCFGLPQVASQLNLIFFVFFQPSRAGMVRRYLVGASQDFLKNSFTGLMRLSVEDSSWCGGWVHPLPLILHPDASYCIFLPFFGGFGGHEDN